MRDNCEHRWIEKIHDLPLEGFTDRYASVEVVHCTRCGIVDYVGQKFPDHV